MPCRNEVNDIFVLQLFDELYLVLDSLAISLGQSF